MNNAAQYGDDSPIAAFATALGISALTLIRCSGKNSLELAAGIFSAPEKLLAAAGSSIVHGWIVAPNAAAQQEKIDEVLVSVFRSPKSYTGEDSLDISCHGGFAAGRGVMAALQAAGFRSALPGEFTFRAFLNGKLDLTRCESVMELVSAKTGIGRLNAVRRLSGLLEDEINAVKKDLVTVLSGAEIFLDYSEDEIEADDNAFKNRQLAESALARLETLSASWRTERIYQEGILAVIAGRPNAGKSSLFNLLLKEERSIVTEIPGTTRDWIEAWISIEGIPVRLADTAGLRDSSDQVEKIGVERSRNLLQEAGLILYLIDGSVGFTREDRDFVKTAVPPLLLLWNKTDLAPLPAWAEDEGITGISIKTGEGISGLLTSINMTVTKTALSSSTQSETVSSAALGSERQKKLVENAVAALKEALLLQDRKEPMELIAPLLREAVNALGEITGEVSTADILEEMFSKFCIGK